MGKKWENGSTTGTVFAFPGHTRGKGDPRKIKTSHKVPRTCVNDSHRDHQAAATAGAVVAWRGSRGSVYSKHVVALPPDCTYLGGQRTTPAKEVNLCHYQMLPGSVRNCDLETRRAVPGYPLGRAEVRLCCQHSWILAPLFVFPALLFHFVSISHSVNICLLKSLAAYCLWDGNLHITESTYRAI